MPTLSPAENTGSSSALSMRYVSQCSAQMSRSFAVFELSLPPTTIILSQRWARVFASFCRLAVALHIVAKTAAFVHSFFRVSAHFFPFAGVKGGLSRKSQGFLFQFRMVFQQFHQFFAALYDKILPFAVAYNPLHLGDSCPQPAERPVPALRRAPPSCESFSQKGRWRPHRRGPATALFPPPPGAPRGSG